MARNFKSVEPVFVKLGVGDDCQLAVEGYYVMRQDFNYRRGDAGVRYVLRQEDGTDVQFLGSAQLNNLMGLCSEGDYVRVEFVEELDTGQPSPAKIFNVMVDSGD